MIAAGYGNVSDFEIIWTVVAGTGFVFSLMNLYSAWGDYKHLKEQSIFNSRRLWARAAIITETGRAYLQLLFLYVGILAMQIPDPPSAIDLGDKIKSAIARWGFLVGAIVVASKTAYTWYVRRRLVDDERR